MPEWLAGAAGVELAHSELPVEGVLCCCRLSERSARTTSR
jgi:hypothetical protein